MKYTDARIVRRIHLRNSSFNHLTIDFMQKSHTRNIMSFAHAPDVPCMAIRHCSVVEWNQNGIAIMRFRSKYYAAATLESCSSITDSQKHSTTLTHVNICMNTQHRQSYQNLAAQWAKNSWNGTQ